MTRAQIERYVLGGREGLSIWDWGYLLAATCAELAMMLVEILD